MAFTKNLKFTTSLVVILSFFTFNLNAQINDDCKLSFGTNLAGLADYGRELPFVDLMHNARTWYTQDINNPNGPFNSENAQYLSYRSDGYPTHVPQSIDESSYDQKVLTIWAETDAWPAGQYTVLWEGTGELSFWGSYDNLNQTNDNRIVFDFNNPIGGILEMTLTASDINDPIHNIRVLMPGTEFTYDTDPFYSLWLDQLSMFPTVRFMDWGQTNNWGATTEEPYTGPDLFDWDERSTMDHYTWAYEKGIPYEMMIKLMNDYDIDGWVCVPHRASNDYIQNMAELFNSNVEDERHLTVEYSNEVWNFLFHQTHWAFVNGCENTGLTWPEGIVPYIQNCLDVWSSVYQGELDKITRVGGVQTGWQDVSNRIINNLAPGSFDAISPTYYFPLTESGDQALDALGSNATVADVAFYAREGMNETKDYLLAQKNELSDPLGLPLVFYEGGQHLTPHPFGVYPTYANALLEIQRDTAMYNMYNEWFDFLETLQEGDEPIQLMNFSFIAERDAQYGSWGILETIDQDTSIIPAPKFKAIAERIGACGISTETNNISALSKFSISPNPNTGYFRLNGDLTNCNVSIYDALGKLQKSKYSKNKTSVEFDISSLANGLYFINVFNLNTKKNEMIKFVKSE